MSEIEGSFQDNRSSSLFSNSDETTPKTLDDLDPSHLHDDNALPEKTQQSKTNIPELKFPDGFESDANINLQQAHLIGQAVLSQILLVLPGMIQAHSQRDASLQEAKDAFEKSSQACADTERKLRAELLEINNLKSSLIAQKEDKIAQKEEENDHHSRTSPPTTDRLTSVERICDQLKNALDKQEQYTRKKTINFINILININRRTGVEDTTEVIIEFCKRYLNIHINKYDISVAHRMPIAADKKKFGRDYIPPIYCQFVNRSVAILVMKRRRMLRNARNSVGQKYDVEENLTLHRRLLKDRVENELHSYKFKWVKNGSVYVRKNSRCNALKIDTVQTLEELLLLQNARKSNAISETANKRSSNLNRRPDFSNNHFRFTYAPQYAPEYAHRSQSPDFPCLPPRPSRGQNLITDNEYDWYDNEYVPLPSYSSAVVRPRLSEEVFNTYPAYRR